MGGRYGHNELHRLLIVTAPGLASIADRKAVIKQQIAENTAQIAALTAALTAKNLKLNEELTSLESEEAMRMSIDNDNGVRRRKRGRDD